VRKGQRRFRVCKACGHVKEESTVEEIEKQFSLAKGYAKEAHDLTKRLLNSLSMIAKSLRFINETVET